MKNYDGRSFYLSWYPLGLLARSETLDPPAVPVLAVEDRDRLGAAVFRELASRLPWVAEIDAATDEVRVEGGWVYSQGRGQLDDPKATVHSRELLGDHERGHLLLGGHRQVLGGTHAGRADRPSDHP